ncbi:hypothetical protein V8G54_031577 [Vigna mungo]|uniref:Uncharacterized protein n=1 Tax=Vigna mungo TaxID=3915 RepID=A0AAQ3MLD5_VIGMU
MFDMRLALLNAKLDAVHKGELVLLSTLASCFPDRQIMSQDDFITHVAWPGDQAHSCGGGDTSAGAQAMEEDDTEEDSDVGTEIVDEEDSDAGIEIVELRMSPPSLFVFSGNNPLHSPYSPMEENAKRE